MAGRVAWRSSASSWGITAASAVASTTAPATTTAAGPRSSIAWASWAINFNTDVGSFSLLDRQNFRFDTSRALGPCFRHADRLQTALLQHGLHVYVQPD